MATTAGGYWSFVFLGGCVLLPYNCVLQGQPYFDKFPFDGMKFPFTSMISYSVCLCLAQVLLTMKGENFTLERRMTVSFIGTLIVCVALLLVTLGSHSLSGTSMYIAGLASVAALGFLNALMQTAIFGLAGSIGPEMSAAIMLGLGVSGFLSLVLSLLVQAIDKGAGVSEEIDGLTVTITGFAFCFFYTFASIFVYRSLSNNVPEAVEAIGRLERRRSSLLSQDSPCATGNSAGKISLVEGRAADRPAEAADVEHPPHVEILPEESTAQKTFAVLREIAPQAINVFLVFVVTMSIFPGVLLEWKPLEGSFFLKNTQLFGTILIGCFQVFDTVGRSMGGCVSKCIAPGALWIFVALRFLFVPLFMLGQRSPKLFVLWGSDEGRLLLCALMATTNGLFSTLAMMFGPERCPNERREPAGIAMSCTMVTGIFAGSLLSLSTQLQL